MRTRSGQLIESIALLALLAGASSCAEGARGPREDGIDNDGDGIIDEDDDGQGIVDEDDGAMGDGRPDGDDDGTPGDGQDGNLGDGQDGNLGDGQDGNLGDGQDGNLGDGNVGDGDGDGSPDVPPGDASPAITIDENNVFPSPLPPGNLTPQNAPQIIVFGWDDIAFTGDHADDAGSNDSGMNFIHRTWGALKNPDGKDAHVSFYQNAAYLPNTEVGGPWGSETNLMLAAGRELVAEGFEVGSHTFDHLETNATWNKVPAMWRTGSGGGWAASVGTLLDKATWLNPVLNTNQTILLSSYNVTKLFGFRAPRLEINGNGLMALAEAGYLYDTSIEEGLDWEHITAAVAPGTDTTGFKWVPYPYTLDNGSPGTWQSQDFGDKEYVNQFPKGLWEVPVYMLYIPDNGLQQRLATRMKTEITMEDVSWVGDRVREITAFDFNTFLYARMTKAEWLEVMKYNFLLRYNGNRAPMTFGAHPEQFSVRYDVSVLGQANNADFLDVLNYNRFSDRKAAVKEFVTWVKTNYPNDAYFLSGKELIDYMKKPFDKTGAPVAARALATPASDNLFQLASTWTANGDALGSTATTTVTDGNTLSIAFKVAQNDEANGNYAYIGAASYFAAGSLANVSHIDIVYESARPFRMRLVPEGEGAVGMQVLLAGTGERTARIPIGAFRPDNYTEAAKIKAAGYVDAAYMQKVVGISFESALTSGSREFTVNIKRIVVHGLSDTSGRVVQPEGVRRRFTKPSGVGSSALWPAHAETHLEH